MPGTNHPIEHTRITADLVRKSKRHTRSGFDANADPVLIGPGAQALSGATNAVAAGAGATVDGGADVAVGSGAYATLQAVAVGYNSQAGDQGTSVGAFAVIGSDHATSVGYAANASYSFSTALGAGAATDRASQIMLGAGEVVDIPGNGNGLALRAPNGTRYKLTVSNAGATVWTATP